jgi:hypothetical protein
MRIPGMNNGYILSIQFLFYLHKYRLSAQTGMLVIATSTFHCRTDHGFYAFVMFVKIKRPLLILHRIGFKFGSGCKCLNS